MDKNYSVIKKELIELSKITTKVERENFLKEISQETLKTLIFLLDGNVVTNINTKKIQKDLTGKFEDNGSIENFEDLLTKLPDCTGKDIEIAEIQHFIKLLDGDDNDFLQGIVTKSFKCGLTAKTLNENYPGSIYVHEIQQAFPYEKHIKKLVNRKVAVTQKLDGVRITAFKHSDRVSFVTRQGKTLQFPELEAEFLSEDYPIGMYDGEVITTVKPLLTVMHCEYNEFEWDEDDADFLEKHTIGVSKLSLVSDVQKSLTKYFKAAFKDIGVYSIKTDYNDKEYGITLGAFVADLFNKDGQHLKSIYVNITDDRTEYSETMKIIGTDEDKVGVEYHLFDYLPAMSCKDTFSDRMKMLDSIIANTRLPKNLIKKVNTLFTEVEFSEEMITAAQDLVTTNNWEGVMLNTLDGVYKFGRSADLLKVKKFHTIDLRIQDIEIAEDGKYKGQIKAFVVYYKGFPVKVGSGLDELTRALDKDDVVGRIIEVQYFEETTNKADSSLSLRFPTFKHFRDDKTEESYN